MTPEWVTIAAFTSVHEAHLAHSVLEAAGFDVTIADEHLVSMDWFLSNAIGGVKVLVREDRAEEAKALLASSAMTVDPDLADSAEAAFAADPFDLQRFVDAQDGIYDQALAEIKAGLKQSHWMWFIFPQFEGLGSSPMSQRYAIKGRAEARAYLDHPVLGARLIECAEAALAVDVRLIVNLFHFPDDLKLQSSATLFAAMSGADSVFERLLAKWFGGEPDQKTLSALSAALN
jgi:uncharacterized protein (DUF1810 family)